MKRVIVLIAVMAVALAFVGRASWAEDPMQGDISGAIEWIQDKIPHIGVKPMKAQLKLVKNYAYSPLLDSIGDFSLLRGIPKTYTDEIYGVGGAEGYEMGIRCVMELLAPSSSGTVEWIGTKIALRNGNDKQASEKLFNILDNARDGGRVIAVIGRYELFGGERMFSVYQVLDDPCPECPECPAFEQELPEGPETEDVEAETETDVGEGK